MKPSFSTIKKKFLLPGLALLLGLLLVEVILFILDPYLSLQGFYSFDPKMGFRVNAGARYGLDRANQFGFNDRHYALGEHPGSYRVLILGDSFNWMGGPVCNYTSILERKFSDRYGEGQIQIINAGYSATHTAEQLEALRKFGLQYRPDLVVLGFFAGNDLVDGSPHRIRLGWVGTTIDVDTRREFYAVLWNRPILLRSRLFSLIRDRYLQWRSSGLPQYPLPPLETRGEIQQFCEQIYAATPPQMSENAYLQLAGSRLEIGYSRRSSLWAENEAYILGALDQMQELVRDNGAEFMVVGYPAEFQVDPVFRHQVFEAIGRAPQDYVLGYTQKVVREHCQQKGYTFHDMLSAFQAAHAHGERLYLPRNTHWNWAGNQLAADLLFEWIRPQVEEFLVE